LTPGHSVVVFEEPEYGGRQRAFSTDTKHAGIMNDLIRSLVVVPVRIDQLCYTVYEHYDHEGEQESFCGDLSLPERWQGKVSGVRVHQQNVSLVLYEGIFVGQFRYVTGDVPRLGETWNDSPASIQVRPWMVSNLEGYIQPRTLLFEDRDFSGKKILVEPLSEYVGDEMNEKVSSIMCEGQCSLLLFEDRDYGGQSKLLDGSHSYLSGFDNKLSSLMVIPGKLCVTLFEQRDFGGESVTLCNDIENLEYIGFNDKVSSLRIKCHGEPCSVELFEHKNYDNSGKVITFHNKQHVPYIGDSMNNQTTSLKLRPTKLDIAYVSDIKARLRILQKGTVASVKKSIKDSLKIFAALASKRVTDNRISIATKSNSIDLVKYAALGDEDISPITGDVLSLDKEGATSLGEVVKNRLDLLAKLLKNIINDSTAGVKDMKIFICYWHSVRIS
jgi:hypothetical protein